MFPDKKLLHKLLLISVFWDLVVFVRFVMMFNVPDQACSRILKHVNAFKITSWLLQVRFTSSSLPCRIKAHFYELFTFVSGFIM